MIHAQVDVELRDHERIMGAELADVPEAFRPMARAAMLGLFTWCLLHGQAKRIDGGGAILRGAVHCAIGGGQETTARHLVASGLLEERDGCYIVRNYAQKNRTKDEIEKSIADTADRKRRSRSEPPPPVAGGHGNVTRDITVPPGSGSDSLSLPELPPPVGSPREAYALAARDPLAASFMAGAYAEGQIAAGAPTFRAPTNPTDTRALDELASCVAGLRGEPLAEWIRNTSAAYRRAMASHAQFQRGFSPQKCLEWVNAGRYSADSGPHLRAVPDTPPAPYHALRRGYERRGDEPDTPAEVAKLLAGIGGGA